VSDRLLEMMDYSPALVPNAHIIREKDVVARGTESFFMPLMERYSIQMRYGKQGAERRERPTKGNQTLVARSAIEL